MVGRRRAGPPRGGPAGVAGDGAPEPKGSATGGLRRHLLAIAGTGAALFTATWLAWSWRNFHREQRRAEELVAYSAEVAATTLSGYVFEVAAAARNFANQVTPADLAAAAPCPALFGQPGPANEVRTIGRYDLALPDGTVLCSTDAKGRAQAGTTDAGAPWLTSVATDPIRSYVDRNGEPVWGVGFPMGDPERGRFGVVMTVADASPRIAEFAGGPARAKLLLWDGESGLVLSGPGGRRWTPTDPNGRIVASRAVEGTSFRIGAGLDRSAALSGAWSDAANGGFALLGAIVAMAVITSLVHRRIVQPVVALTDAATRTAEGGTADAPETGPAELAELAGALNHLTATRQRDADLLRAAVEERQHAFQRLDQVLAHSSDMVLIVDDAGTITFASPAAERLCGPGTGAGTPLAAVLHPDDGAAVSWLLAPGGGALARAELRTGSEGAGWHHVEVVAADLREHPAVRGVVINGRDIGERVAEQERRAALEEAFHQSQRLESLGRLAGGVAHDFKNLLSVVMWTAELAANDPASVSAMGDDLEAIRSAAARGVDLAQQLLTFSRRDPSRPDPIDVGAQVRGVEALLRRSLGPGVELDVRVAPDLPAVRMNRSRFDQVVVNLAVNANDAMPAGGRVVIEAATADGRTGGRQVALTVSDAGIGMPPEVVARAFEPFFTTKPAGQGTGLGLAIVHGAVTAAGGEVVIDTRPGLGTTVRVLLPVSSDPAAGDGPAAPAPVAAGAEEVVLVVEDEVAVLALAERMVRAAGYRTVATHSPVAALELVNSGRQVDLVLTDVVMPGMSGVELVDRLRNGRPGLPAIYMSGHTAGILERRLAGTGEPPVVLEKPFSQAALANALQGALAPHAAP